MEILDPNSLSHTIDRVNAAAFYGEPPTPQAAAEAVAFIASCSSGTAEPPLRVGNVAPVRRLPVKRVAGRFALGPLQRMHAEVSPGPDAGEEGTVAGSLRMQAQRPTRRRTGAGGNPAGARAESMVPRAGACHVMADMTEFATAIPARAARRESG